MGPICQNVTSHHKFVYDSLIFQCSVLLDHTPKPLHQFAPPPWVRDRIRLYMPRPTCGR